MKKVIFIFFAKLLALIFLWYSTYIFWLGPQRILDKPITDFLSIASVKVINLFSSKSNAISWQKNDNADSGTELVKGNKKMLGISDSCNGLDLIVIYCSILILLPSNSKRKILFVLIGIAIILFANIIRISLLYYISFYHKSAFHVSHHYVFTLLMYALIFCGWFLFIKRNNQNEKL